MIFVFDTETSNLPQKALPLDHPAQGRIVQLACLVFDKDFKKRASFCALIQPDGWVMQPGAQAAHGITQEECNQFGISIKAAMELFDELEDLCEYRVAHNIEFDRKMLKTEYDVMGKSSPNIGDDYCTMKLMTDVCQLPSARGGYKWPKLMEAYQHATGHTFIGAHDALRDCTATAEVFKWLIDHKRISLPSLVLG